MKKTLILISLIASIFTAILLVPIGKLAIVEKAESKNYVTGRYGKYCYVTGRENGNIKYPEYYSSLELCGKPLK